RPGICGRGQPRSLSRLPPVFVERLDLGLGRLRRRGHAKALIAQDQTTVKPPPPPARALPPGSPAPVEAPPPPRAVQITAAIAALLLLHVTHPLAWGQAARGLWFPAAGVGLAVLAWRGPRGVILLLTSEALVFLQALLLGTLSASANWP